MTDLGRRAILDRYGTQRGPYPLATTGVNMWTLELDAEKARTEPPRTPCPAPRAIC